MIDILLFEEFGIARGKTIPEIMKVAESAILAISMILIIVGEGVPRFMVGDVIQFA